MAKRNPRKFPAPGDLIEYQIGDSGLRNTFRVHRVDDGVVYYWDEGVLDRVPIDRWRKWFVGKRGVIATPCSEE